MIGQSPCDDRTLGCARLVKSATDDRPGYRAGGALTGGPGLTPERPGAYLPLVRGAWLCYDEPSTPGAASQPLLTPFEPPSQYWTPQ